MIQHACLRIRRRHRLRFLSLLVCCVVLPGCATYQFGNQAMFRPGIRTIHVPVVRNETFRHDLGVRLTEALGKEIERRTNYKVTGDPNADSVLTCRVVNESKRVLTETDTDDPRALDAAISVEATWTGRSGELLMQNSVVPNGALAITFGQDARFVPEAGQSIDSATQTAIENLAERIVSQMEIRW
ncbi:MAG: LPS assembly lipoprotein LptE [Planctomycetota bacterium]